MLFWSVSTGERSVQTFFCHPTYPLGASEIMLLSCDEEVE